MSTLPVKRLKTTQITDPDQPFLFLELPLEIQWMIFPYLSDQATYNLVNAYPKYFGNHVKQNETFAKKYYTYLMNKKIENLLEIDDIDTISSPYFKKDLSVISEKISQFTTRLSYCGPSHKKSKLPDVDGLPTMPNVKTIELSLIELKKDDVAKLLLKCPNLKKLEFYGCSSGVDELEFSKITEPMQSLEEIKFDSTYIHFSELRQLFLLCPNLKKLELHECSMWDDGLLINELVTNDPLLTLPIQMNHLEEFAFVESADGGKGIQKGVEFDASDLYEFLLRFPNLKKIVLGNYTDKSDAFKAFQTRFSQLSAVKSLESITFDRFGELSLKEFEQMIEIFPNLKTFNIIECGRINLDRMPNIIEKPCLEHLSIINSSKVSPQAIESFLIIFPNLKSLNLNLTHFGTNLNFSYVSPMKHLKTIDLSGTSITQKDLKSFQEIVSDDAVIFTNHCPYVDSNDNPSKTCLFNI
jgi:hypothetical protein